MQLTIRPILEQLGLTENEIKVYEALLKRKSVVAATLAREIGLDKSSTYRALESMTEQGLVIVERKKRGTIYQIGSLQILKDSLQKKMMSLKNTESSIDDVIENIKNQALTGERDTYIKVEKGIEAHMDFMERSLQGKEGINREIFSSISGTFFKDPKYEVYSRNFLTKRIEKNIENRTLYRYNKDSSHSNIMRTSKELKKELRILPESMDSNNYVFVWDDNVEILSFNNDKSDFIVIHIKDQVVSELIKQLFEYVFDRSAAYFGRQILPVRKIGTSIVSVTGIGTWGVGGYSTKNVYTHEVEEVDGLRFALGCGMSYIDTSHAYGAKYSLDIVSKAIANFSRTDIFINSKIGYQIVKIQDIEKMVDMYLQNLKIDYLDQIMIHGPSSIDLPIGDVVSEMENICNKGKAKNIAVSNFNIGQLKEAQNACKRGISAHEIHYNLMIRANEENGVINYCRDNNIMLIAYQPLRRGFLAGVGDKFLNSLAEKYDKTQVQIILNWLSNKEHLMYLVKSTRGSHINENVAALGWKMDKADYKRLDEWRMTGYVTPKYDVTGKSQDGLKIWKL